MVPRAPANALLANRLAAHGAARKGWDDFAIQVGKRLKASDLRMPLAIQEGPFSETERRYAENLKFSSCLAESFLRASVRARLFDSVAAEQVVALPAVQHA